MPQNKSKLPPIILIIGILAVIFGSLGILGSSVSVITQIFIGKEIFNGFANNSANASSLIPTFSDKYFLTLLISEITLLFIRITELTGGIFILYAKKTGRTILNVYAITCLVQLVLSKAFELYFLFNTASGATNLQSAGSSTSKTFSLLPAVTTFSIVTSAIGLIFGAAWPVLVLVLLRRKSANEFFEHSE
jgi:hypothetical protein